MTWREYWAAWRAEHPDVHGAALSAAYRRERYAADPEYAEHKRKHWRERYATDPEYAKRERERGRMLRAVKRQLAELVLCPVCGEVVHKGWPCGCAE